MGTIFMLLSNPIKAVSNIKRSTFDPCCRPRAGEGTLEADLPCCLLPPAFQPFQPAPTSQEPADLLVPQIIFVLCQCLTLALGLWKCNEMGIIPRGAADWLAFESRNLVRPASHLSLERRSEAKLTGDLPSVPSAGPRTLGLLVPPVKLLGLGQTPLP